MARRLSRVVQVNQPPAPSQQRLLCKLSILAGRLVLIAGNGFEPLSAKAIRLEQAATTPAEPQRRSA
jgi:hypothetical protein